MRLGSSRNLQEVAVALAENSLLRRPRRTSGAAGAARRRASPAKPRRRRPREWRRQARTVRAPQATEQRALDGRPKRRPPEAQARRRRGRRSRSLVNGHAADGGPAGASGRRGRSAGRAEADADEKARCAGDDRPRSGRVRRRRACRPECRAQEATPRTDTQGRSNRIARVSGTPRFPSPGPRRHTLVTGPNN